ncbi:transcription factor bHLH94-like [Lolium rigidum]|uniref:transcription factor bHLH94-like n=1 Tax=Lolium rigidum TaxID=89674 RepID=UPI001F5DB963|nr:transcription factor bHLH94-like [Lolium rigidum]
MTLDAMCAATDVLVYNTFNAAAASSFHFGNAGGASTEGAASWMAGSAMVAPPVSVAMPAEEEGDKVQAGRRKRRRRAKVCRNREDAESQRMTHIAVERNRRRQMNDYLAELRSLMPESYAHRGDQASIVGGAIDFVKELEQLLQSLEAQKCTLLGQKQQQQQHLLVPDPMPAPSNAVMAAAATTSSGSGAGEETPAPAATHDTTGTPFAGFFTYPQYVWRLPARDGADDNRAGLADVEVTLVETHASVRVMAPRLPGQLLRMVAGMERLRLAVLHLNVTTLGSLALYSLSVKVEEGCGLATADDIAAAVHQLLCFIDAETTSRRLLELDGGRPDLQS